MSKKVAIIVVATNYYFLLGLRLLNKWSKLYNGNLDITFHFVSDHDPTEYLSINNVVFHNVESIEDWTHNSMLRIHKSIELENSNYDYIYWLDADTNINYKFKDEWFKEYTSAIHDYKMMVWMTTDAKSSSFIPFEKDLNYYQACFWGANKDIVIDACKKSLILAQYDNEIGYKPAWADEKYLNKYFYYNKPFYPVRNKSLPFKVADKGKKGVVSGIDHKPFHDMNDKEYLKLFEQVKDNKDKLWDIEDYKFVIQDINTMKWFTNE